MPESSMVGFDLLHQVHGFVVGVPTDPIHNIDQAHREFGTTFDWVPRFASHDGTDMRLAEAHQAIGNAMLTVRVHPELLTRAADDTAHG
jgi:hypothetical protein